MAKPAAGLKNAGGRGGVVASRNNGTRVGLGPGEPGNPAGGYRGTAGVISELRQRVESLEARLSGGGPGARIPGHKPAARGKKGAGEAKKPRRKRQQGFARLRMGPTAQVTHAPESCSEYHTTLSGGWVQRTREVIELPVCPAEVTEHVFIARRCPLCRKRRLPRDPLREVAVGRQRLGINPVSSTGQALVSLIAALREEGRLPIRTIQWYLQTVHQLKLSAGAIVRVVHQVAQQARPAVAEALERIRSSPVVHADETGWRENGVNGYVWTPGRGRGQALQHVHGAVLPAPGPGRGGAVVDEVLGESFGGILASGFYVAYHHYPGLKQRCWAHLLRDIHKLKVLYPEDAGLVRWARRVQRLYAKAVGWAAAGGCSSREQLTLERRLLRLCRPFLEDPPAVQGKLCRRIERHIAAHQ